MQSALDRLVADAEKALAFAPVSVTEKTRLAPSGDPHDYMSLGPYWWPDPEKTDGLPWIRRDGQVNPETRTAASDQRRLDGMENAVTALALAYDLTGKDAYAAHAARILRVWFLDPATCMNPHMEYGQAVPGLNDGRPAGLIEAGGLVDAADASGLLVGSPHWSAADEQALQAWCGRFLDWMLTSKIGLGERASASNHGTMYDVRAVKLALKIGRYDLAREILSETGPMRIAVQIEPDGRQPRELARTKSFGYSCLNLGGLVQLADHGKNFGVDPWHFETTDGRSIHRAIEYLLPYVSDPDKPWPYQQIDKINRLDRMSGILRRAAIAYGDERYAKLVASMPGVESSRLQLTHPLPAVVATAPSAADATGIGVRLDFDLPAVRFAVEEVRTAAREASSSPLDSVALAIDAQSLPPQGYRIERDGRGVIVTGGDAIGAMYGGLDVAEAIRTGSLELLAPGARQPHIARRGIKFNLPLDLRTPTYSEPGHAAQQNIPVMWEMEFWVSFLDDMARHRYNVLSLWSLHPFPSMVRVPEFPEVALEDVWRTREKFDSSFNNNGHDYVRPAMLANHEVVKRITVDEKIAFWRAVMQHAKDRGIDVYLFTWNIFLYGAEGRHGIGPEKTSPRAIEYYRATIRETIKTYPLLAGLGITAGEGMTARDMAGMDKEEWLWEVYGEGIRDGLRDTPDRPFRLIHRFHMTGLSDIRTRFAGLPCPLDLSFKYAIAHMYSVSNPGMIQPVLPLLGPELRTWLTVRNDDIYSFRWGDVDYARAFIKAIPPEDKIAGFYMGPDGYVWGRDFLAKDPAGPRETVMQKQWLSFGLWGRLAYAPDLPASVFERQVAARFPGADTPRLMAAWADASKTFPWITRFFWGSIDIFWFPEACRWQKGFYTVRDFMQGGTMPGAGVLNIMEWRAGILAGSMPAGVTPVEIAATLEGNANRALDALPALRALKPAAADCFREYDATLGDIEAMALLGRYYAAKTRGACELALFDKTGDVAQQAAAVRHLEDALGYWKAYAEAYTRQYVQPVWYNRSHLVDIRGQTSEVESDVRAAREWRPGTIDESAIKRKGSETGFKL